jgi:hypothetical protein
MSDLQRVIDISLSPAARPKYHYRQFSTSPTTLCGGVPTTGTRLGIEYQRLHEVPADTVVNCKNCLKAVEMALRQELPKLSSSGLEKVMNMVQGLRNGDLR